MNAAKVISLLVVASSLPSLTPATASPEMSAQTPHRWSMANFGGVLSVGLEGHRSFKNGEAVFHSAKCADCHRFGSFGKGNAPNLTFPAKHNTPEQLLSQILNARPHFEKGASLTDGLSQAQILDLLAFLISGGDPTSDLFFGTP